MTNDTASTDSTDEQHGNTMTPSIRGGLRDATVPLANTGATVDNSLELVGDRLAGTDILGLGEATHGTREFFELKRRLVRHLVAEHGVRAVALGSGLPETMGLHDYVVHGDGDAREALAGVHIGCWEVESVLSLVEWLRAFNIDRPPDDRVGIYGFAGGSTHGAVERLRDHFGAVDPNVLDEVAEGLTVVDDGGELLTEDGLTAVDDVSEWIEAVERVVKTLRTHLDERRATHVSRTSERGRTRARRYVAVIEQVLSKTLALGAFEGDARAEYSRTQYLRKMRRAGLPGRTMADNVGWIRDHADADGLVLWAHDAHLNRVSFTFPDVDASAPSLGNCLADRHGDDYFAVGFSFARGSFRAVRENDDGVPEPAAVHIDGPVPGPLDAALDAALDEPHAFLDLRAVREDGPTADWLAAPRSQFRTGGTYDADAPEDQLVEYVYADAFDGLCFVAETTPARPLEAPGDTDGEGDDEDTADAA